MTLSAATPSPGHAPSPEPLPREPAVRIELVRAKPRLTPARKVAIAAGASCALFSALALLAILNNLPPIPSHLGVPGARDLIALAILAPTGIVGVAHHRHSRRVRKMSERFPDFLHDLADARRAGLTPAESIRSVALRDYGPLSGEVRKLAAEVSWGSPFGDALRLLASRVPSRLIHRTVPIVVQASGAGGEISDVLDAASRDARQFVQLDRERRGQMAVYVMVVYVSFAVFLSILLILAGMLLPSLSIRPPVALPGTAGAVGAVPIEEFQGIYFLAAIVQGAGSGFVAGAMAELRVAAGAKHAFVMVLLVEIAFLLM